MWAVIVMIRRFAWCGTSQSMSAGGEAGTGQRGGAGLGELDHRVLEDLLPGHAHARPAVPVAEGPPST